MAALTETELAFYKELFRVVNEPSVLKPINTYIQKELDKAVLELKKAEETLKIGRLQGKIQALELVLKLKDTVTHIIRTGV